MQWFCCDIFEKILLLYCGKDFGQHHFAGYPRHCRMKRSTLSDISFKTGLSISTVSRVLNGKAKQFRISAGSQQRVYEVVKQLNYRPNVAARTLRNNESNTIGLLVPGVENPFFASIAGAVIRRASAYGYPVMLIDTREDPLEEERAVDTLLERSVDGIIMVPCASEADRLESLSHVKPLVLVDRYFEQLDIPYVCTDNYHGAYMATQMLLQAGHRRIMCIRGVLSSVTSRRRVEGYMQALRDAGFGHEAYVCGDSFSIDNGYSVTMGALESGRNFTAVFALSSTNLLGALKALRERGVSIPQDVSMVSFDDNIFLNYLDPAISCVSQPVEEIGAAAVKILVDKIRHVESGVSVVEIAPRLVNRDSVVCPPSSE